MSFTRYLTPTEMHALVRKPTLSNGTPTSDAAARKVEHKTPALRNLVWVAIRSCGEQGATADELEDLTGLAGNTIRPRIVELRERNLVRKAGIRRKTRMGNAAEVYVTE